MSASRNPFPRLLRIQERSTRHSTYCCAMTAAWLRTIDRIHSRDVHPYSAPRWIADRWTWGWSTSGLPICVATRRAELSCGSLAAIAWEVAKSRGLRAARLQTVVTNSPHEMVGYEDLWQDRFDTAGGWIQGRYDYHVVVLASIEDDITLIWDPTKGLAQNLLDEWREGRILAMKIVPDEGVDGEDATSRLKSLVNEHGHESVELIDNWLVNLRLPDL